MPLEDIPYMNIEHMIRVIQVGQEDVFEALVADESLSAWVVAIFKRWCQMKTTSLRY